MRGFSFPLFSRFRSPKSFMGRCFQQILVIFLSLTQILTPQLVAVYASSDVLIPSSDDFMQNRESYLSEPSYYVQKSQCGEIGVYGLALSEDLFDHHRILSFKSENNIEVARLTVSGKKVTLTTEEHLIFAGLSFKDFDFEIRSSKSLVFLAGIEVNSLQVSAQDLAINHLKTKSLGLNIKGNFLTQGMIDIETHVMDLHVFGNFINNGVIVTQDDMSFEGGTLINHGAIVSSGVMTVSMREIHQMGKMGALGRIDLQSQGIFENLGMIKSKIGAITIHAKDVFHKGDLESAVGVAIDGIESLTVDGAILVSGNLALQTKSFTHNGTIWSSGTTGLEVITSSINGSIVSENLSVKGDSVDVIAKGHVEIENELRLAGIDFANKGHISSKNALINLAGKIDQQKALIVDEKLTLSANSVSLGINSETSAEDDLDIRSKKDFSNRGKLKSKEGNISVYAAVAENAGEIQSSGQALFDAEKMTNTSKISAKKLQLEMDSFEDTGFLEIEGDFIFKGKGEYSSLKTAIMDIGENFHVNAHSMDMLGRTRIKGGLFVVGDDFKVHENISVSVSQASNLRLLKSIELLGKLHVTKGQLKLSTLSLNIEKGALLQADFALKIEGLMMMQVWGEIFVGKNFALSSQGILENYGKIESLGRLKLSVSTLNNEGLISGKDFLSIKGTEIHHTGLILGDRLEFNPFDGLLTIFATGEMRPYAFHGKVVNPDYYRGDIIAYTTFKLERAILNLNNTRLFFYGDADLSGLQGLHLDGTGLIQSTSNGLDFPELTKGFFIHENFTIQAQDSISMVIKGNECQTELKFITRGNILSNDKVIFRMIGEMLEVTSDQENMRPGRKTALQREVDALKALLLTSETVLKSAQAGLTSENQKIVNCNSNLSSYRATVESYQSTLQAFYNKLPTLQSEQQNLEYQYTQAEQERIYAETALTGPNEELSRLKNYERLWRIASEVADRAQTDFQLARNAHEMQTEKVARLTRRNQQLSSYISIIRIPKSYVRSPEWVVKDMVGQGIYLVGDMYEIGLIRGNSPIWLNLCCPHDKESYVVNIRSELGKRINVNGGRSISYRSTGDQGYWNQTCNCVFTIDILNRPMIEQEIRELNLGSEEAQLPGLANTLQFKTQHLTLTQTKRETALRDYSQMVPAVTSKQQQVSQLTTALNTKTQQRYSLFNSKNAKTQEITSLNSQIASTQSQVTTYQTQYITPQETALTQANQARDAHQATINAETLKIQSLQSQIAAKEDARLKADFAIWGDDARALVITKKQMVDGRELETRVEELPAENRLHWLEEGTGKEWIAEPKSFDHYGTISGVEGVEFIKYRLDLPTSLESEKEFLESHIRSGFGYPFIHTMVGSKILSASGSVNVQYASGIKYDGAIAAALPVSFQGLHSFGGEGLIYSPEAHIDSMRIDLASRTNDVTHNALVSFQGSVDRLDNLMCPKLFLSAGLANIGSRLGGRFTTEVYADIGILRVLLEGQIVAETAHLKGAALLNQGTIDVKLLKGEYEKMMSFGGTNRIGHFIPLIETDIMVFQGNTEIGESVDLIVKEELEMLVGSNTSVQGSFTSKGSKRAGLAGNLSATEVTAIETKEKLSRGSGTVQSSSIIFSSPMIDLEGGTDQSSEDLRYTSTNMTQNTSHRALSNTHIEFISEQTSKLQGTRMTGGELHEKATRLMHGGKVQASHLKVETKHLETSGQTDVEHTTFKDIDSADLGGAFKTDDFLSISTRNSIHLKPDAHFTSERDLSLLTRALDLEGIAASKKGRTNLSGSEYIHQKSGMVTGATGLFADTKTALFTGGSMRTTENDSEFKVDAENIVQEQTHVLSSAGKMFFEVKDFLRLGGQTSSQKSMQIKAAYMESRGDLRALDLAVSTSKTFYQSGGSLESQTMNMSSDSLLFVEGTQKAHKSATYTSRQTTQNRGHRIEAENLSLHAQNAQYDGALQAQQALKFSGNSTKVGGVALASTLVASGAEFRMQKGSQVSASNTVSMNATHTTVEEGGQVSAGTVQYGDHLRYLNLLGTVQAQNAGEIYASMARVVLGEKASLLDSYGRPSSLLKVDAESLQLNQDQVGKTAVILKLRHDLEMINRKIDARNVHIQAGTGHVSGSTIRSHTDLNLHIQRLQLEKSLLTAENNLLLSIEGQLTGLENTLRAKENVSVSTGTAHFGATVEGKKVGFEAKGDLWTTGQITAKASVSQKAGGNATLGMKTTAATIHNEAGGLLKITSSQIAVTQITNKAAEIDILGSQTAGRISLDAGPDGEIRVSGELHAVPVVLENGETVSLIEFIGGVLYGAGIIDAGEMGQSNLSVKETYGETKSDKLKIQALHALVQNASTTALQDLNVAINIQGVGIVHVMSHGKSLVIDVPTYIHAGSTIHMQMASGEFKSETQIDGDIDFNATENIHVTDNLSSTGNLGFFAQDNIEFLVRQNGSPVSVAALGLTIASERDVVLEGTCLAAQRRLALSSKGDTVLKAIERQHMFGYGLSKTVFEDVKMAAEEVLIEAENKFKGITNVQAQKDLTVRAKMGMESDGRVHTYASRKETRTSGWIFKRTEHYYETSTDRYASSFVSEKGRVNLISTHGGVGLQGAQIVGSLLGNIFSSGDVNLSPLMFSNTSSSSYSDWGGFSSGSAQMTQQGAHTATLGAGGGDGDDPGNVRNVVVQSKTGSIYANGAHLRAPQGEAILEAEKDVFYEAIELENTMAIDERSFGISFGSYNKSEFLTHVEAIHGNLKQSSVMGAAGSAFKALADLQATTKHVNDFVQGLASGDIFASIGAAGLGRVRIGFDYTHHESRSRNAQLASIQAQKLHIKTGAEGTAHLRGTEIETAEIDLETEAVNFGSKTDHVRMDNEHRSVGLTLDPFTQIPGDELTFGMTVSRHQQTQDIEHQASVRTLKLNFIRPAKVTIYGNSEFKVEDIVGDVEASRLIREDLALKQSQTSMHFKATVGLNTGSLNMSESLRNKTQGGKFDCEREEEELQRASKGKVHYTYNAVEEEETSSSFEFSLDAVGLMRLGGAIEGSSSLLNIPLEGFVETNNDKSSFFLPSGSIDTAMQDIDHNIQGTWDYGSRFAANVHASPERTVASLLSPLQTGVEEIAHYFETPLPENSLYDPTSAVYHLDLTEDCPQTWDRGIQHLLYDASKQKVPVELTPEQKLMKKFDYGVGVLERELPFLKGAFSNTRQLDAVIQDIRETMEHERMRQVPFVQRSWDENFAFYLKEQKIRKLGPLSQEDFDHARKSADAGLYMDYLQTMEKAEAQGGAGSLMALGLASAYAWPVPTAIGYAVSTAAEEGALKVGASENAAWLVGLGADIFGTGKILKLSGKAASKLANITGNPLSGFNFQTTFLSRPNVMKPGTYQANTPPIFDKVVVNGIEVDPLAPPSLLPYIFGLPREATTLAQLNQLPVWSGSAKGVFTKVSPFREGSPNSVVFSSIPMSEPKSILFSPTPLTEVSLWTSHPRFVDHTVKNVTFSNLGQHSEYELYKTLSGQQYAKMLEYREVYQGIELERLIKNTFNLDLRSMKSFQIAPEVSTYLERECLTKDLAKRIDARLAVDFSELPSHISAQLRGKPITQEMLRDLVPDDIFAKAFAKRLKIDLSENIIPQITQKIAIHSVEKHRNFKLPSFPNGLSMDTTVSKEEIKLYAKELARHLEGLVMHPETVRKRFDDGKKWAFYDQKNNELMIFDPAKPGALGTAFIPDLGERYYHIHLSRENAKFFEEQRRGMATWQRDNANK